MILPTTLSRYTAKQLAIGILAMFGILLGVIYLFETVELLRRLAKRDMADLALALKMGVYKLPEVGQELTPFAVLFGTIFTLWRLNRHREWVIARSVGISIWQFILPFVMVGFLAGILHIGLINPVSATLISHYEQLETEYMKGRSSAVNLAGSGLWLRQDVDTGYAILHARTVDPAKARFGDISLFYFTDNSQPVKRVDGRFAQLKDGFWEIQDGWLNLPSAAPDPVETYRLPTDLTFAEIEDSFAAPQTISIYRLPNFIDTMEKTGFSALRLKSYFYELLILPILFIGLTLLGTIIAHQPPRRSGGWRLIIGGVMVAFILFFFGDVLQALGLADALPLIAAAWAPAILSVLIGITGLLYLEDG